MAEGPGEAGQTPDTLLAGQQELALDPGPVGEWFWGVDPGANLVGLAWSNGLERDTTALRLAGSGVPVAQRMHELYAAVKRECEALMETAPATAVVCEQAVIRKLKKGSQHPITVQANGVTQAAVYAALRDFRVPVFEMGPGTWKSQGLGHGGLDKGQVLSWAMELLGVDRLTQDEADALGLAEAARRSVRIGA